MKVKKIAAVLSAAAILVSVLPMNVMAENTIPDGYLYYEDFEGEYNTAYNPPAATNGTEQRWTGALKGDEVNHYAEYSLTGEQNKDNMTVMKMDITGKDRKNPDYPLDRNTWYELGYKFNTNGGSTRFGSFMQVSLGSVAANTVIPAWNTDANRFQFMQLTGTDDSGNAKTIKIDSSDVDGLISTKLLFNMHGDKQTAENCDKNGEAVYYVSYKNKSGETVTDHVNVAFPTAQKSNYVEARYAHAFSGFLTSEGFINANPLIGTSFYIDDIYVKQSNTYTVKFDTGYEDVTVPDATAVGGVLVNVPVPEKDGAEFIGWYEDKEYKKPFDNINITSDITVYAKWKSAHTITFNSNGGSAVEPITTTEGSIALPTAPKKTGYTFVGWFKDEALTEPFDGTGINGNMTVYAKWNEGVYYEDFEGAFNVAYNSPTATGDAVQRWTASIGGDETNHYLKYTIDSTAAQAAGNMTLMNVDVMGERKNPNYPLDRNAWYELGYKFNMNDCRPRFDFMNVVLGSLNAETQIVAWKMDGRNSSKLTITGTDDSGNAKSISVDADEVDGFISTKLMFNLHGNTQNADNFKTNGEAIYYVSYTTKTGEQKNDNVRIAFPSSSNNASEGRSSNAFKGFTSKEGWNCDPKDGSEIYIDDIYIRLSNTYTVKFDTGYEDVTVPDATVVGGLLTNIPVPEKDGAEFIGWYEDEELTKPFDSANVKSNITVYAKWKATYTITFNSNGGSTVEPITTTEDRITLPSVPAKAPYIFAGWYKDEALTVPFDGTGIEGNMTVFARWSDIVFSENFDGEEYNKAFDSPEAQNGAEQRWSSEVVKDSEDSGYIKYTFHNVTEDFGNNTIAYNAMVWNGDRTNPNCPLDRNTWYELGYKFDMNDCTARFTKFMQIKLGSTQAESAVLGWETDAVGGKEIRLKDPSGNKDDIVIKQSEVDGFITTRILFNLHGDTQTADNFNTNGEARCYVSYTSTAGEKVNIYREYGFPSSKDNAAEARSSRFLMGFTMEEGYNSYSAEGSSFMLDDIYIKLQGKAYCVKFDSDGGTAVADAEADLFGNIVMPTAPTKEGYAFAGWFLDSALTMPFDGTGVTSHDITVYARWQQAPKIVSITPRDGSTGVNAKPEIKIVFDSEMRNETLTKNNIKVLKDGEDIKTPYELIITNDNSRNTIVKIVFNTQLDFNRVYSVKVLTGVANTAGNMENDVTSSFTTAKMALNVNNITVKDEDGNTVTRLKEAEGKRINISFEISSNTDEAVSYTPILSIMRNGTLKETAVGEINGAEAEINVPSDTENDELGLMIFDSFGGMKPLTEKKDVIK